MILKHGKKNVSVIFDNGVYRSSSSVYCATNDSQLLFYTFSILLEVKQLTVTFLHLFGYGCVRCITKELEIQDGHHLIRESKSIYKAPGGYVYNYSGFLPILISVRCHGLCEPTS